MLRGVASVPPHSMVELVSCHAAGCSRQPPVPRPESPQGPGQQASPEVPGQVVEINPAGEIVRSVGGADGDIRMAWCSGVQPLQGGGFMVSDYQGRRILEFNADWELVNEWRTGSRTVASLSVP
jgi:hypothetical protein